MSGRRFTDTTAVELWERIDAAHARFADLVRDLPTGARAHGSTWDVREVVAHVLTVVRRYTEREWTSDEGLAASPAGVAELNEREVRALDGLDTERLLTELRGELDRLRSLEPLEGYDLDRTFRFHGGQDVDLRAALANLVGELLVHGHDLARAARRPWPIGRRDAELVIALVLQVVPGYVRPDAPGSLHLELRVPGTTPWAIEVADGTGTSRAARRGDRPDVVLRISAPVLLLGLYSRLTPVGMALRGALVVGGRRPWRITRLGASIEQA